jgi:hypothetical protein
MSDKTNEEDVFDPIQMRPEGLDDDDICALTGITRQPIQQLCNQLGAEEQNPPPVVEKPGKRTMTLYYEICNP